MGGIRKGLGRLGALLAAIGILAAILIITAVVGDAKEFNDLLGRLHWSSLIILLSLAIVNHALRYWRWELLLRRVASSDFKRSTAILLFSAGSLLIFTPARIGEAAKSVYAQDFFNIPVATSLPILIVERLVDMCVMALLASLGLLLLGEPFNLLLGGIILGVILTVIIFRKPLLDRGARWSMSRLGADSRLGQMLNLANNSQSRLLSPGALGINLTIGTSAWLTEVTIYFFSLFAVGIPVSPHLFVVALAVFPLASLGGSISFLPGGLGVTEGGITALGILLGSLPREAVVLSALLSRLAILGIIVLAGVVSVLLLRREHRLQ
ncbi:lysylphosphatidylglycerol synthase transmembrane domain-containing protein [Chloroflexota bacterium]